MKGLIQKSFTDAARTADDFHRACADALVETSKVLVNTFLKGRKLLLFGNGGSAADAQHLAAEFVNRFLIDRKPLPAIALTTDTSILTSVANDVAYDKVFARQVEALGRVGDAAIAISTSGASPSIIEGVLAARRLGIITIGLTGAGGTLAKECDYALSVPSHETPRIQECHILAGHILCELVERELVKHFGA